ncbi:MAG: RsmD family RNA methyltransferase [Desulfurococcaceae archaeon]
MINGIKEVDFEPRTGLWFSGYLVNYLRKNRGIVNTTLDLGLTYREVYVYENYIVVNGKMFELNDIDPGSEDKITFCENNDCYVIEVRNGGYYKLKAIGIDLSPTLEINGIHMHRITGLDPWRDAASKVKVVGVKKNDIVLDTCMGLGYTAINSILRGAAEVYTFEIDPNVIWVAERNSWSRSLSRREIHIVKGDITELIKSIDDEVFDKIIHDPPRFTSSTGSLYSFEFYTELFRVLKPCGKMFHYTGEPLSGRLLRGISDRLRKAGFIEVKFIETIGGFLTVKPCLTT